MFITNEDAPFIFWPEPAFIVMLFAAALLEASKTYNFQVVFQYPDAIAGKSIEHAIVDVLTESSTSLSKTTTFRPLTVLILFGYFVAFIAIG